MATRTTLWRRWPALTAGYGRDEDGNIVEVDPTPPFDPFADFDGLGTAAPVAPSPLPGTKVNLRNPTSEDVDFFVIDTAGTAGPITVPDTNLSKVDAKYGNVEVRTGSAAGPIVGSFSPFIAHDNFDRPDVPDLAAGEVELVGGAPWIASPYGAGGTIGIVGTKAEVTADAGSGVADVVPVGPVYRAGLYVDTTSPANLFGLAGNFASPLDHLIVCSSLFAVGLWWAGEVIGGAFVPTAIIPATPGLEFVELEVRGGTFEFFLNGVSMGPAAPFGGPAGGAADVGLVGAAVGSNGDEFTVQP